MQLAEELRVLLFLAIIAGVYVLAAGIIVRSILRKLARATVRLSSRRIWLHRIVLGMAFAGLLCAAYAYFIEPYWPSVTRLQIRTAKLTAGSRPIRIAHISDLHSDPKTRLEDRLPGLIATEKPDVIVFTGDCVNSPEGLPISKECLSRLAAIAPTFVVRGNWDVWFWRGLDLFGDTGVRELNGDALPVTVGTTSFWIAGVAVENEDRLDQAVASIPPGAFTVFLYHYPDLIPEVAARKVDLYCAGHTHGGQVALPFYGALITLSKFGKQFEGGLYRVDQTWLYVNRGIGMEGGGAPRVRFCARPEITMIEVGPDQ